MSSLTLAWEYLTGYAVATDPSDRNRAEWPPHPARVFMAMAAAWFETRPPSDADDQIRRDYMAEGDALRVLEASVNPEMFLPATHQDGERSNVTVYVPVNDKAGPAAATLQSVPALTRKKQARHFPRMFVGNEPCFMHWPNADINDHIEALRRICAKVTRIGHSSSLIWMWVAEGFDPEGITTSHDHWRPTELEAAVRCRRMCDGMLNAMPAQTQIPQIERFAHLVWRIQDAKIQADEAKASGDAASKKTANAEVKEAKAAYEAAYGEKYKQAATPPPRLRPRTGLWTGYARTAPVPSLPQSKFDNDLIILTFQGGRQPSIIATLAAARALRNMIIKYSPLQPAPSWVTGHNSDGSPATDDAGHMACIPLPFVGAPHADGHLLGLAIAFPKKAVISPSERGHVLGPLLMDQSTGQPCEVILKLGCAGKWIVRKQDWQDRRETVQPENWTAMWDGTKTMPGSYLWHSATPVVLDRFPKADRRQDRAAWENEVCGILADACQRIGLPRPLEIEVGTTAWLRGSPRAVTKQRLIRGSANLEAMTTLGDGFPAYPQKGTRAPRPQVHARIHFAQRVVGPVLIGAGRYRGYGLFKPWKDHV